MRLFSLPPGTYSTNQTISLIGDRRHDHSIHHQRPDAHLDGQADLPAPFSVADTTVKAYAYASGLTDIAVVVARYVVRTLAPPRIETPSTANTVTITLVAVPGAQIYYTTNG